MEQDKLHIKIPMMAKILDTVSLLFFFGTMMYLLTVWSSLPELVPSHYNLAGEADDWQKKWVIFLPPSIGIVLWFPLHILEKKPHLHNYIGLTEENKERLYKNSMLLMNVIKNEMLLFFSFGSWNDVKVANGNESLLGVWDIPILFLVIFGTLIFFMIRSFQIIKRS